MEPFTDLDAVLEHDGAIRVRGWLDGVACVVRGPEITPEHDCDDCNAQGAYACSECDGTGSADGEDDCGTCDGTGRDEECARCDGCGTIAESRTGRVIVTMIGDDGKHAVDRDDCYPLDREAFCGQCGQIGCGHDAESDS